jgi:3-phosphoshikimate 1-carboxyvinyltransferase
LATLGVEHTVVEDGIDIIGNGDESVPSYGGGRIDSLGDHRIAMAFAIASLRAGAEIVIDDCANVATSFPDFVALAQRIGMRVDVEGPHGR